MEKVILKSIDDYNLDIHLFEVENPKGYIQIIHGMEEYQERYLELVEYMNLNGYTVITSDLRGHGKACEKLGFFANKDGYKLLISDEVTITNYIVERYNSKVIIFAHSFGSLIIRNLMKTELDKYEAIIMSGYPSPHKIVWPPLLALNIIKTFKGPYYKSKLVTRISNNFYTKYVKNPCCEYAWVSFDIANALDFKNNPYSGFGFTVSGYIDLIKLVGGMNKVSENITNANIPILLLSGDSDPCVGFIRGSDKSIKLLNKQGFMNIKRIIYENARHEIIHEECKMKVFEDIDLFLKKIK